MPNIVIHAPSVVAPNVYWTTARDDYVLANSPDPETEETRVVRYRVEMPSRIRP
jgi:hypothetical protein